MQKYVVYHNIVLAHSICNLKFNVSNEIPVGFLGGLNYDYHFIIKELANKFKGQFDYVGENKEKYKTFSVPVKKDFIKMNKVGNKNGETISYKIKFIESEIYGEFIIKSC